MSEHTDQTPSSTSIHTDGGAVIQGDIHAAGDFVGRDKIIHIANQVVQQATTAAEEARQAQDLARQRLAEGVRVYAGQLAAVAADNKDTAAAGPYKGLLAYTLADAELFFGRDQASRNLLAQMQRHRLTILQSESGAGKSSLLRAGIAPRLLAAGHLPMILRSYNRPPDLVVKQTFLPDLAQTPELEKAPLRSFLRPVTEVLGPRATLVLILDQFEEFFTLLPDERVRTHFVDELADCVEDESLRVRWVLALRSEFFGDLATFRPRIRNPFQNDFRLNRLTRDEAREVIIKPADSYGITYEPALVDRLLDDLSEEGQIHPPQVQLVCDALYQKLTERQPADSDDTRVITEAMYEAEGEARGILRGHLNRVLQRSLPTRQERDLARRLLVELVSSDQRRIRRTRSDLATGIVDVKSLDEVLDELVVNRLLNVDVDEKSDERSYEIAHDYLLGEVQVDPEVQAQKAAQELLDQEVEAYRRYGTLLDRDKYQIIDSQRAALLLNETAVELLLQSQATLVRRTRWLWAGVTAFVLILITATIISLFQLDQTQVALVRAERAEVEALGRLYISEGIQAFSAPIRHTSTGERSRPYAPLLGLRLASEGLAIVLGEDEKLAAELAAQVAVLAAQGRVLHLPGRMDVPPVGGYFLTHSGDSPTELWPMEDPTVQATLGEDVSGVHWSPDGTRFVIDYLTASPELWHVTDGKILELTGDLESFGVRWSTDSRLLVTNYYDAPSELRNLGNLSVTELPDRVYWLAWSPAGTAFVVGYASAPAELRDLTNDLVVSLSDTTRMIKWSADGSRFLTTYENMPAELRDASGRTIRTLSGKVDLLLSSPNGAFFFVDPEDAPAQLWSMMEGPLVELSGNVWVVDWSPDSGRFGVRYHDAPAELRQVADRGIRALPGALTSLSWSPDSTAYVGLDYSGSWADLRWTDKPDHVPLTERIRSIDWSPDSSLFHVTYESTGAELRRVLDGHPVPLTADLLSVAWAPSGTAYIVTYHDASAELRWTDKDETVILAGIANWVDWSASGDFFVISYKDAPPDIGWIDGQSLYTLSIDLVYMGVNFRREMLHYFLSTVMNILMYST